MATKRDYYDVLGIAKGAVEDDIRRAFRKLAFEYHPDRNSSPDAAERFKEINEAYEVLRDGEKRQTYDRFGHAGLDSGLGNGFSGFGGFGIEDIFDSFFGRTTGAGRRPRAQRGADLRVEIDVSFADAVFGAKRELEIPRPELCQTCTGSGMEPGTQMERCSRCNGTGELRSAHRSIFGQFVNVSICDRCGGEGRVIQMPCTACKGQGRVQAIKKIELGVPAGIENGTQVRLTGEGEPPDVTHGGRVPGDLYVVIRVPASHTVEWEGYKLLLRRQGHDLVLDVPINVAEAALGADLELPSLDGSVDVTIAKGTQYGKVFRVKGRGVPHLRDSRRGDLQVRVHVMIPSELTKEQAELFKKLDASFRNNRNANAKSLFEKVKEALGV